MNPCPFSSPQVSDADLVDYYLAPFQACVQTGGASAVMCR